MGSGTPISAQVWTQNQIPVMVNGRGDLDRTPVLSYTDMLVSHTVNVSEGKRLRFELNVVKCSTRERAAIYHPP